MKVLRLAFCALVSLASASFSATSFCITVSDPCCAGGGSTNTHQLNETDSFTTWYVHYDTGSENNKVTITARLDGDYTWQLTDLCGCGNTTVNYPTANEHLILIEVECTGCNVMTCSGTSYVQVYTPSTHVCKANCDID